MSNFEERLLTAEKKLKAAENKKIELETQKKTYESNLLELVEQMKNEGTSPETIEDDIKALEKEIEEALSYIEANLPEV